MLALLSRAAAWSYRLALPHWARKSKTFSFSFFPPSTTEESYEIKLPAIGRNVPSKEGEGK